MPKDVPDRGCFKGAQSEDAQKPQRRQISRDDGHVWELLNVLSHHAETSVPSGIDVKDMF